MTASSQLPAPHLMPLMRYRDLSQAMGWLEQAFGFEKQIAVSDSEGDVIYGQMTYRGGLIMMGAVRDTDLDKLMRQPDEVGGIETQSCYLVVEDADQHHQRALDAGAEVVLDLKSDGLGRRGYSCRDPEGHIWSFGTYHPGKGLAMTVSAPGAVAADEAAVAQPARWGRRILMSLAGLIAALGATGWALSHDIGGVTTHFAAAAGHRQSAEIKQAYADLVTVRAEKREADARAAALSKDLDRERARFAGLKGSATDLKAAAKAEQVAKDTLAREQSARATAEQTVSSLRDALKREQDAREAAVEAKRVIEEKLAAQSTAPSTTPAAAPKQEDGPPVPLLTRGAEAQPPSDKAGTERIETSATNARQEPEPPQTAAAQEDVSPAGEGDDASKDETPQKKAAREKRERAAKPKIRRAEARRSKLPPAYVTDMRNVWPYAQWSR